MEQLGGTSGRLVVSAIDGIPAAALVEVGDERRPFGVGGVDREEQTNVERPLGEPRAGRRRRLGVGETLPLGPAAAIVPFGNVARLALEQPVFGADAVDRLALASDAEVLVL